MPEKMWAAHLKGRRRFEMVQVDIPRITDDQVLAKISKVAICGSDRGIWDGHHFMNEVYAWEDFEPGDHGHEACGNAVKVGKNVRHVEEGDQIVRLNLYASMDLKMACFAEYAVCDAPIECNGGDPEVMCFADPVTVALNHVHHADVHPGDTVLVLGQGLLGLLCAQLLIDNHVNVLVTDLDTDRLAIAERFGAVGFDAAAADYETRIQDSAKRIDAIIECSGADEAVDASCRLLSVGGTLVIMGATRTRLTLDYTQLRVRGARVVFPMNRVNAKDNWEPAARILQRGKIEVKSLISHRDKLANLQQVLENYNEKWIRVVLTP
ncbi:MAG TPA: zinc-binding dehydrogenase [Phycisphaerae bacterium]|nr:zinc-binding dehydrogenase [Phycisphaerae bacterium]